MNYNPHQANQYQPPISIGDWVVTLIVTSIPVIGFIMLIVWAVDTNTPKSKANFAKASLILYALAIAFFIFIVTVIGFGTFSNRLFH